MTHNGYERRATAISRTATGALDHAALEARARELRRESVGLFLGWLRHGIGRALAKVANRLGARSLPGQCMQC